MAIPAYNNYRSGANDTVLKSDVANGFKAYHAYNATKGNFCTNLAGAGLSGLMNSETYSPDGFVGFASDTCSTTLADINKTNGTISLQNTTCVLDESTFKLAVVNEFDGNQKGFHVSNINGAPKQAGDYCKKSATDNTTVSGTCQSSEANCTNVANDCDADGSITNGVGVWVSGGTLCN